MREQDDVCFCPCHQEGNGLMHFIACYATCPKCKKRILNHRFKDHVADCNKWLLGGPVSDGK
jgi:hypothetical protein